MNWHYFKNGQNGGPADSAALGRLIQGGDLGGNDLVWREGWAEWRVLGQVEELAHHLQSNRKSTPPPLPVGAPGTVASATQARTFAGIEFVWCPPGTAFTDSRPKVSASVGVRRSTYTTKGEIRLDPHQLDEYSRVHNPGIN